MTMDYRLFSKALIAFAASKGFKSWSGVIENMTTIEDKAWKTEHPYKSQYASKCITKAKSEGANNILKQEYIMIDCATEFG